MRRSLLAAAVTAAAGVALVTVGGPAAHASVPANLERHAAVAPRSALDGFAPGLGPDKAKSKTTNGAGYLSKPGVAFAARTYVTVPTATCTGDDAEAAQGTFLFQPNGSVAFLVDADELCRSGSPSYDLEIVNYIDPGFVNLIAINPGDQVETDIEENSSETYLFVEDITTGQTAHQDDDPYQTAGTRMLDGEVNPTAITGIGLADFGTALISNPTFNYKIPSGTRASKVVEETNGVVQAKPSSYSKTTSSFTVTWKHS